LFGVLSRGRLFTIWCDTNQIRKTKRAVTVTVHFNPAQMKAAGIGQNFFVKETHKLNLHVLVFAMNASERLATIAATVTQMSAHSTVTPTLAITVCLFLLRAWLEVTVHSPSGTSVQTSENVPSLCGGQSNDH